MRCYSCTLAGKCRAIRQATKRHFAWSFHNIISHPLSEILYLVGLRTLSDRVHDWSIPEHQPGTGRG